MDGTFRVVGIDRAVLLKDAAQAPYVPSRPPEGLETGLYKVASFGVYRRGGQRCAPCSTRWILTESALNM